MAKLRLAQLLLGLAMGLGMYRSPAYGQEKLLELRGRVILPQSMAHQRRLPWVTLYGATRPFLAQTRAGFDGRFKFSKLLPGPYTVSVFVRGHGESRQTIDLGPSAADARGRVELELQVESREALPGEVRPGTTISVRQLSIPWAAREEYARALQRMGKHDVAGAVEHLEKALAKASQFSEALNLLGTIAFQAKDYVRAEDYFRKALKISPEAFEPLVNLGGALLAERRPLEALDFNRRSVEARPRDALANSQMGINLFALGKAEQAVPYLQQAKKLDPAHFSHPQLLLAEIYLRRSDNAQAAAELEDFVRLHPDDPDAPKIRAEIARLKSGRQ